MNIVSTDADKGKLVNLKWFDILILTVIFFGYAIYLSTMSFFALDNPAAAGSIEFSKSDNWRLLLTQGIFLLVAFIYLKLRNFDFSQWHIRVTPKAILLGVLLFIGMALVFDAYYIVLGYLFPSLWGAPADGAAAYPNFWRTLANVDLSLVLYALLNGFYEEIYFLGLCLSVESKYVFRAFLYSLVVRYSFHTYQGNISALAIGILLGTIFYLLYIKTGRKNLVPFFIAHSIADILGTGLIGYLYGG